MRNVIDFLFAVAFWIAAVAVVLVALALSPLVLVAYAIRKVRRGR